MKRSEFGSFLRALGPHEVSFDGVAYTVSAGDKRYLAEPPFPPRPELITPRNTMLAEHLASRPKIAVVLVHMGEYAIGLFEGTSLVLYKTGHHFIRGRTKKGGSSSSRYARVRSQQRSEFLDGVCFSFEVLLGQSLIEHIFFGGPRETVKAFAKECGALERHKSRIQARLIPARHANLETLRECIEDVWRFTVKEL
ncbi:MAG: hypothetical protein HYS81_05290 [Candidatus Aenigmatarchaeota archaeon]|nr:MAG: hypothetical protein HYS81_05290 [Candidatus Aenigmarchaeota archaeon]